MTQTRVVFGNSLKRVILHKNEDEIVLLLSCEKAWDIVIATKYLFKFQA